MTRTGQVDVVEVAVKFGRMLRAVGLPVTVDRLRAFVDALACLDPCDREQVFWAGRLTLCGRRDDFAAYERAFAEFFQGESPPPVTNGQAPIHASVLPVPTGGPEDGDGRPEDVSLRTQAARADVLRPKDIGALTATERAELARLVALLKLPRQLRRTRRWQPARHGAVDRRATMRQMLRAVGEPAGLQYRAPRSRPRKLVVLADVSGSMSAYADALLRFAHAATRRRGATTEVFTVGTRLTRVTRELALSDPDVAMRAVAKRVPDWSGGTRLGELLKRFLDEWGQRGLARGAVVVILSDGWERGDVELLAEQMARLRRLAHQVVWANPLKARSGYQPLAGGMAAALPHVDDFVEGHSLEAFERLARVVTGAAAHSNREG